MKVRCYRDGHGDEAREYPMPPHSAVLQFCAEYMEAHYSLDVVVVPVDEEARALPGWHTEEDAEEDPVFKMFVATPIVKWDADEVATFNRRVTP